MSGQQFTLTEHAKGWVDAVLRLKPPCEASDDYNRGYLMGTQDRAYNAKLAIEELKHES